jgi:hypothetical protein
MSRTNAQRDHPYRQFESTRQWSVLDRAIGDLVENHDLSEATAHEYVVGYLCKALATAEDEGARGRPTMNQPLANGKQPKRSREEMKAIFRAAREEVQAANPANRDILAEFLAERRAEAASE